MPERIYQADSRRILATVVRLLGDPDVAEDAMHEAFAVALGSWQASGIPDKPRPWLVSTARLKAIDTIRRRARVDDSLQELALRCEPRSAQSRTEEEEDIADDRLRLIFTCCHPSLAPEAQVALALREVCGLTTEEIALVERALKSRRLGRIRCRQPLLFMRGQTRLRLSTGGRSCCYTIGSHSSSPLRSWN